jgi:hypothetical protein
VVTYFGSWGYISVLSVEIMMKILYPANVGYKKRVIIYHLLVWGISGSLLGYAIIVGKPGESKLGTCLIEENSEAE